MTSNPVNSDRVDALIEYAKACSKPWISVEVVACLEELLDYRVNHAECSVTVETDDHRAETITGLCDRIDRIHLIAIGPLPAHEKLRQIEEWAGGFSKPPRSSVETSGVDLKRLYIEIASTIHRTDSGSSILVGDEFCKLREHVAASAGLSAETDCDHDWRDKALLNEPPLEVCSRCGRSRGQGAPSNGTAQR